MKSRAMSLVNAMKSQLKAQASHQNQPSLLPFKSKRILFTRHGQATHNPRAEEAKANGCSHETFLKLMQEDDEFDAELTPLGVEQALHGRKKYEHLLNDIDLVVSSPLSRALKTADLIVCPERGIDSFSDEDIYHPKRICIEELREINGWLLNAKRRTKTELQSSFHQRWDFDLLVENDEDWTYEMEKYEDCSERGYQALLWLLRRTEDKILVVSHGGILRFSMVDHPLVKLVDERKDHQKRFSNCEMREYEISYSCANGENDETRPVVTLTEILKP
jgi:broad specificity phosphatase PhoE